MAAIFAGSSASLVTRSTLVKARVSCSPIVGLPSIRAMGKVVCSMEEPLKKAIVPNLVTVGSVAAAAAAAATISSPAMALVDERMNTEGTGLPFGLSNNLLGWILLGVFGLIWSVYFVYTSGLDEDEDSGLSL